MSQRFICHALRVVGLVLVASAALHAQGTPDGDTPANEGICDELIGFTPGLYGLCVAFCEAQDCDATFDPDTGEITFDPNCNPSNPKVLERYNLRRTEADPPMPCVNILDNGCPCWTDSELDAVGDDPGRGWCRLPSAEEAWVRGYDLDTGGFELAQAFIHYGTVPKCWYISATPAEVRYQILTAIEYAACYESIAEECLDRGF